MQLLRYDMGKNLPYKLQLVIYLIFDRSERGIQPYLYQIFNTILTFTRIGFKIVIG